ncbi:hypothetical protein [Endozoicomonas atrinae]|uniref:hypothetical protein n=1 Tax=Endozoicomonas atrinae TaxID=1333660 RepID=UPI003AFFF1D9
MENRMKSLIIFFLMLFIPAVQAYDSQTEIRNLQKEIQQLRKDIRRLERRVMALEDTDSYGDNNTRWGCYMNDIRAGGLFSHAATEAEARGKILSQCTSKKGACFDNQITCSKSD